MQCLFHIEKNHKAHGKTKNIFLCDLCALCSKSITTTIQDGGLYELPYKVLQTTKSQITSLK